MEEQQQAAAHQALPLNSSTLIPDFEVDPYPISNSGSSRGTPIISQDDNEDTSHPAANTRQQRQARNVTQDYMLHMIVTPGFKNPIIHPEQLHCDSASAVLDDDTGKLLEYRHLIRHPKHKNTWSQSFGREIR